MFWKLPKIWLCHCQWLEFVKELISKPYPYLLFQSDQRQEMSHSNFFPDMMGSTENLFVQKTHCKDKQEQPGSRSELLKIIIIYIALQTYFELFQ